MPCNILINNPKAIRCREALYEQLRAGQSRRLTIIQAGAGCGKTLLLTTTLNEPQQAGDYSSSIAELLADSAGTRWWTICPMKQE